MASEVIYARVPASLKRRLETFAGDTMSQSAGVAELLERGLEMVSRGAASGQFEQNLAQLSADLATTRKKLEGAELAIELHQEREKQLLAAYTALGQRTEQPVGMCPTCQTPVTGRDLLVNGHCRNGHGIASLLTGGTVGKGGLNQQDWVLLVGAIGLVLAIAYLQSKS
jgi:hypothetical protein